MEKYIKIWMAYCFFLLVTLYTLFYLKDTMSDINMVLMTNTVNAIGLVLIYMGVCTFLNIDYKTVFFRYGLVIFVLGALAYFYELEPIFVFIIFGYYQLIVIGATLVTLIKNWGNKKISKYVILMLVLIISMAYLYISGIGVYRPIHEVEAIIFMALLLGLDFLGIWVYQLRKTRNLVEEKNILRALIENATDIIFSYTLVPYPKFTYISPSVERITGYKQAYFYHDHNFHISLTHETHRDKIETLFSGGEVDQAECCVKWQRKDGEFIYLEFHNKPVFKEGKLISVDGILRDVTHRKESEEKMIQSNKSKQILLSYISHELRTPITNIIGYAEALKKDHFKEEKEKQYAVDLIWDKTVFLQKLVEDLFQLSKMETDQFSFEFMQMKVEEVFNLLKDHYKQGVFKENVFFESAIDSCFKAFSYEILVDIKRITQVVDNLITNALKYGEKEEGVYIKLNCLLDEKKQAVLFQVIDQGEGISKEEQTLIFKRFYHGESHKAGFGTGIGLSLSKQIVRAHKGEISVASVKHIGSTFQFTIPLYKEEMQ